MLRPHEIRYLFGEFPVWRDIALWSELDHRAFGAVVGENARSFVLRVTEVVGRIRNARIGGLLRRIGRTRSNGQMKVGA